MMNSCEYTKILIIALMILTISVSDFIPQRTIVIDSFKNQNFLVRGNLPLKQTVFQMEQLKRTVQNITELKPGEYEIVVYSLMNALTVRQTKRKYIEENYFQRHKEYPYKSHPVLGSFINPVAVPKVLRDYLVAFYQYLSIDNLTELLDQFRHQLIQSISAKVVYFHCSQGVDRTGYIHAVYSMKYQNKTLEDAYAENIKILKGFRDHMHFNTYYGMQWYCLFLGRTDEECLKKLQD